MNDLPGTLTMQQRKWSCLTTSFLLFFPLPLLFSRPQKLKQEMVLGEAELFISVILVNTFGPMMKTTGI